MNTQVVVDDEPAFVEFVATVASAAAYRATTFDSLAELRLHLLDGRLAGGDLQLAVNVSAGNSHIVSCPTSLPNYAQAPIYILTGSRLN